MAVLRKSSSPKPHELDTEEWLSKARRLAETNKHHQVSRELTRVLDEVGTLHPNSEYRKTRVELARRLVEQLKVALGLRTSIVKSAAPPANSCAGRDDRQAGIEPEGTEEAATFQESLLQFTAKCLADANFIAMNRSRCTVAIKDQVSRIRCLEKGSTRHGKALDHLVALLEGAGAVVPSTLARYQQRSITRLDLEKQAKQVGGRLVFRSGPFKGPRPVILRGAVQKGQQRKRRWRLRRFPSGQTRKPGSHRSDK